MSKKGRITRKLKKLEAKKAKKQNDQLTGKPKNVGSTKRTNGRSQQSRGRR